MIEGGERDLSFVMGIPTVTAKVLFVTKNQF